MKTRLFIIGLCALVMLCGVFIIGTSLHQERQEIPHGTMLSGNFPSIPSERGTFNKSHEALWYKQMPEGNRSLDTYYENRAYPGAPPSIPHPLISEKGIGGKTCLQCHENGGFAAQFGAYTPVTPHPQWENCKQCHLPKAANNLFENTNWKKIAPPQIKQAAMPGAPPMIPHDLQLRENCLSCHAGPAAPKEIRTTHPERVNCRQCHLPKNSNDLFQKPAPNNGVFTRPQKEIGQLLPQLKDSEVTSISNWLTHQKNSLHE